MVTEGDKRRMGEGSRVHSGVGVWHQSRKVQGTQQGTCRLGRPGRGKMASAEIHHAVCGCVDAHMQLLSLEVIS